MPGLRFQSLVNLVSMLLFVWTNKGKNNLPRPLGRDTPPSVIARPVVPKQSRGLLASPIRLVKAAQSKSFSPLGERIEVRGQFQERETSVISVLRRLS